jgi:hypothetical protein
MTIFIARIRAWRWYAAKRRADRIYDRPGHEGAWDAQARANDVFGSLPRRVQYTLLGHGDAEDGRAYAREWLGHD